MKWESGVGWSGALGVGRGPRCAMTAASRPRNWCAVSFKASPGEKAEPGTPLPTQMALEGGCPGKGGSGQRNQLLGPESLPNQGHTPLRSPWSGPFAGRSGLGKPRLHGDSRGPMHFLGTDSDRSHPRTARMWVSRRLQLLSAHDAGTVPVNQAGVGSAFVY